jgi:hypothetical protein
MKLKFQSSWARLDHDLRMEEPPASSYATVNCLLAALRSKLFIPAHDRFVGGPVGFTQSLVHLYMHPI